MGFCNFYTPVEGQRQNSIKLTLPNLCNQLVQYSRKANGEALCIYGDHGYQLRPQRQVLSASLTQKQEILIN